MKNILITRIFYFCVCIFITGCSSIRPDFSIFDETEQVIVKKKTLADLKIEYEPLVKSKIKAPDIETLKANYQEILLLSKDFAINEQINYRLAELELVGNEHAQEIGAELNKQQQGYYDTAIQAYNRLLKRYPNSQHSEHLLYQLAKAYELQGQSEKSFQIISQLAEAYEHSAYLQELYFRKGEYLFSKKQFDFAAQAYQKVILGDAKSVYFKTSLYMLAWSKFKLDDSQAALNYFTQVLDVSLPEAPTDDIIVSSLPASSKQIVIDTLRIMSLIFSYTNEASGIEAHFNVFGKRYYEYLSYDNLANMYLKEKRFEDSAATYNTFVINHTAHPKAAFYAIKKIEIYQQGNFPSLAFEQKLHFVKTFGITGLYWQTWDADYQQQLAGNLKSYLSEIAENQYRIAQKTEKVQLKQLEYKKAAVWFKEYIDTFNDNPDILFLFAESLYASKQYALAINNYEAYAYGRDDHEKLKQTAEDAAYTALLAYDNLVKQPGKNEKHKTLLTKQKEISTQKFIDSFPNDSRSLNVLENLVDTRFNVKRYKHAILSAEQFINWPKTLEVKQQIKGYLVLAHSHFNLSNFDQASNYYAKTLSLLDKKDARSAGLKDNYAASIFKQAERLVAEDKLVDATALLLSIIELLPDTTTRKLAQFNASQYLYQQKQYGQAASLLEDFRSRFSQDELAKDIPLQLANLYEHQQDWLKAAMEYQTIALSRKYDESAQEPLYLAAQYFEKAGDLEKSRLAYRKYANTYQTPFDTLVEVRFKLSEIYLAQGDDIKRRFWLKKLIEINDFAKTNTTPRSTYLAAMSAMVFAKDSHYIFNKIKLTLPLKTSLNRKKLSLEKALKSYQKAANYQVAEFSTQANYQIAQVYGQLAKDLLNSERPKNLDALALEQYEILLEEQAYPFEDKAILIHENNSQYSWQGTYDKWVKNSFAALTELLPGRYNKQESVDAKQNVIY